MSIFSHFKMVRQQASNDKTVIGKWEGSLDVTDKGQLKKSRVMFVSEGVKN